MYGSRYSVNRILVLELKTCLFAKCTTYYKYNCKETHMLEICN